MKEVQQTTRKSSALNLWSWMDANALVGLKAVQRHQTPEMTLHKRSEDVPDHLNPEVQSTITCSCKDDPLHQDFKKMTFCNCSNEF